MTNKQLGTYTMALLLVIGIIMQIVGIYTVWCYLEMCGRTLFARIGATFVLAVPITISAAIAKEAVTAARKLK